MLKQHATLHRGYFGVVWGGTPPPENFLF